MVHYRFSLFRIASGRGVYKAYVDALWQWRRVKTSTDTVGQSLEKEFLVDDTAITTTHISRKLDSLENLVRRTGFNNRKKSSHHRILAHDLLKNTDRDLESGEMLNQRKAVNWFSGLSSGFNRIMDRTSSLKSSMHGNNANYLIKR